MAARVTTNTCILGTSEVHPLAEDRAGLGSSNSDERAARNAGWCQQYGIDSVLALAAV